MLLLLPYAGMNWIRFKGYISLQSWRPLAALKITDIAADYKSLAGLLPLYDSQVWVNPGKICVYDELQNEFLYNCYIPVIQL